jgi:hypothetical protein
MILNNARKNEKKTRCWEKTTWKMLQPIVREWVGITSWNKGKKKESPPKINMGAMTNSNKSFQRVMENPLERHLMKTYGKEKCKSIKCAP